MRWKILLALSLILASAQMASGQLSTGWKAHDLKRPAPTVVTPAERVGAPPSDATVLFDGTDLSQWTEKDGVQNWKIVDGAIQPGKGAKSLSTKQTFGDCQLHVEFATPEKVVGNSQGRGNSGIYLMGKFELQVLDSFNNKTYADGSAGSIYGQFPPLVNASRPPGKWQAYDIIFRRPRFSEDGTLSAPARITALHNGVLIQDNSEALGPTNWILHDSYDKLKGKTSGPIRLQYHGNPVRYRNIWIRKLQETRPRPQTDQSPAVVDLDLTTANRLAGTYGRYSVKMKNEKLVLMFGNVELEMVPHSPTEFSFAKSAGQAKFTVGESDTDVWLEFELDAAGKKKAKRVVN